MTVPAVGVAAVDLHKAHAALDHAPRQQTAQAELCRVLAVQAVEPARRLRLARGVYDFRSVRLHAESKFVGRNPCGKFPIALAKAQMFLVELIHEVERAALLIRRHASGWM